MLAAVVVEVLDAQECGFGPAEIPPLDDAIHHATVDDDLPVEVVRREEDQVAAAVAVVGDRVVLVRGHVLVVTGEDDQ